jgi:hypothetical protein
VLRSCDGTRITDELGESTVQRSSEAPSATSDGESSSPSSFDRLCRERRLAGIAEYRGGDPSRPFVGDPIQELHEELADATIYLQEAALQGRIRPDDAISVDMHIRRALTTLWASLRRR